MTRFLRTIHIPFGYPSDMSNPLFMVYQSMYTSQMCKFLAPVVGNDEGGMMNDELGIQKVFVCMQRTLNYIELSGLRVGK